MATVTEIREMAKTPGLWNVASGKIDITDETVSNMDYLRGILSAEIQLRKEKKVKTLKKDSHLPKKTFDKSKVTEGLVWQLQKAEQFDYKNSTQNFVIVVNVGIDTEDYYRMKENNKHQER